MYRVLMYSAIRSAQPSLPWPESFVRTGGAATLEITHDQQTTACVGCVMGSFEGRSCARCSAG